MANVYTNYKAVLSTNELTTLYTVPTTTTGIIKSLRVTNIDEENDCKVSCFVVDSSSISYTQRQIELFKKEHQKNCLTVILFLHLQWF